MDDARRIRCSRCRRQVFICSRCDRGQQYCGARCSGLARRESLRAAGRRYQQSQRGRHCHAERQRRYRHRCRVTDGTPGRVGGAWNRFPHRRGERVSICGHELLRPPTCRARFGADWHCPRDPQRAVAGGPLRLVPPQPSVRNVEAALGSPYTLFKSRRRADN